VVLAGVWVNLCEFVRNQVLLTSKWQVFYREHMKVPFPAQPVNAIMWVVWGFVLAVAVFAISRRFGVWATTLLAWVAGYVLMWITMWNLAVLPMRILPVAVPFSFVEALGAAFLCRILARPSRP
jgi:hypothetical protein